ncbi:MAG: helicase C-terminal domain-containing protein [Planctomycetota bacterium]
MRGSSAADGVDRLLGPNGLIGSRLDGFEERPQQLAMARAVQRALKERRHLIAEAGTGVGKSFAYLIPAIAWAVEHPADGPVVVSTRTIALQEQLEHKDLPFLHSVLPFDWSSMTAVGRNHYLCLRRLDLADRERDLFEDEDSRARLQEIREWAITARTGTRLELPAPPPAEIWEEVQAEQGNCLHRACRFYEACHWQRARRRMQTVQVLVVNHALYCADVALRAAGTSHLPAHRAAVFDEAHHLERVATESFGERVSARTIGWHKNRLLGRKGRRGILARRGSPLALSLCRELGRAADAFFGELGARLTSSNARDGLPLGDAAIEEEVTPVLRGLAEETAKCALARADLEERMELQARSAGLAALAASLDSLCRPSGTSGLVRWIEPSRHGPVLCGSPLDASAVLEEHVFAALGTAVLTSATLGPADDEDFAWILNKLGVRERADSLRLGSPFDYERSVSLILAEALPDPSRRPEEFAREAALRTEKEILENRGHALVLCTSWDLVRRMTEHLRGSLRAEGIDLLVQGDAPLAQLLRRKQEDPSSVLLGTDSLWEGIDLKGDSVTLVVLVKLPFQSPSHPLTRARLEAISARGGDPFLEHTLPEAILKLRQGFGRLIRSGRDRGKVVVLDPRIKTRPYGRRFLASLPLCGEN